MVEFGRVTPARLISFHENDNLPVEVCVRPKLLLFSGSVGEPKYEMPENDSLPASQLILPCMPIIFEKELTFIGIVTRVLHEPDALSADITT